MQEKYIDDATREHPPKEAIEISESENEEKNFKSKVPDKDDNKAMNMNMQLTKKIQEQALRLHHLQRYLQLCEKKISYLEPNQKFPIQESDIPYLVNNNTNSNTNNTIGSNYHFQVHELEAFIKQNGYDSINSFLEDYGSKLNKNNELGNSNKVLKETVKCVEESNQALLAQNADLIQFNEQMKKESSLVMNKNAYLQCEMKQMTQEMTKMQGLQEEYNQLQFAYEKTCDMNVLANKEKLTLLNDISALREHIEHRECDFEKYNIMMNETIAQHQIEKEQLQYETQQKVKRDYEIKFDELRYTIQERDSEINSLKTQLLDMENNLMQSSSLFHNTESQFNNLSSQLKTQSDINQSLQKETYESILDLRKQNNDLNESLSKAQDQVNNAKRENNDIIMKYNAVIEDYEILRDRYTTLKANNIKLQSLYNTIDESNSKIDIRYKMLLTELNCIKEDTAKEVAKVNKEKEELIKQNDDYFNESNRLRIEYNVMAENAKVNALENNTLKATVKGNKCDYENIRRVNDDLELRVKELCEINKKIVQDHQKTKEELLTKVTQETVAGYDYDKLLIERSKMVEDITKERMLNKDKDTQYGNLMKLLRENKAKLMEIKEDYFSPDFCAYLKETTLKQNFFDDIIKVEDFLNSITKEFLYLKEQNTEQRQLILSIKENKSNLQNEIDSISNDKYMKELQIKALTTEYNATIQKLNDLKLDYKALKSKADLIIQQNDKLSNDNRALNNKYIVTERKNERINHSISLYENIKTFIENIMLEMSQCCFNNTSIRSLINDLIKANYDLMQMQRDNISQYSIEYNTEDNDTQLLINSQIESKLKEIENMYMTILKEIKIEKRLITNYSSQTTETALNTDYSRNKLSQELADAKNQLRCSYTEYQTNYHK